MHKIHLDTHESLYPTGYNIQLNLPTINLLIDTIKKSVNTENRIILCCMGSSGAIIAGIAASRMSNVIILHVKKEGESSHTNHIYFEFISDDYIIIIDDFVVSGATISKIYSFLKEGKIKVNCIALAGGCSAKSLIKEIDPDLFIYSNNY